MKGRESAEIPACALRTCVQCRCSTQALSFFLIRPPPRHRDLAFPAVSPQQIFGSFPCRCPEVLGESARPPRRGYTPALLGSPPLPLPRYAREPGRQRP